MFFRRAIFLLFAISGFCRADSFFTPANIKDNQGLWVFDIGEAFITSNGVDDIIAGDVDIDHGDAGGNIFNITASRRLGILNWNVGNYTFHPELELPFKLEIFDENSRSPFLDYNASFLVRWVDFPWNRYLKTTFATGVGLSYSTKIPLMDQKLHPEDRDRSHLKIDWPIQLLFELPAHHEYELMLFISHQSGGRTFDVGGINSVGIGYRFDF
jgi:hypothetical protein